MLATLTDPTSPLVALTASTFTLPGDGLDLEPNTQYWLVIDITGDIPGTNTVGNTNSNAEDAGAASGWSIHDQGHYRGWTTTGGWTSFAQSRVIRIKGLPKVAPPPPTIPPLPTANPDGSYTVPADWPLIPSGFVPGDEPDDRKFRLLFQTSTKRDATSTDIAEYNTHVQNAANLSGASVAIKQFARGVMAVGCTQAVNARANTDSEASDPDAPIYWLNGVKIADDYVDFYDNTWQNQVDASTRQETGAPPPSTSLSAWTGCLSTGLPDTTKGVLGDSGGSTALGAHVANASPLSHSFATSTELWPLYAMSPVFLVMEPIDPNERFDLSVLDDNSPAGFIFRVCGAGGGGTHCDPNAGDGDTSWVPTLNPIVKLEEGGATRCRTSTSSTGRGTPPESGTQVCENGACHTGEMTSLGDVQRRRVRGLSATYTATTTTD